MIEKSKFQAGMHALCVTFNREPSSDLIRVYDGALSSRLTDEEWVRCVDAVILHEQFWPAPATLLRYAQPRRIETVVRIENKSKAQDVYEAIIDSYERGIRVGAVEIETTFGYAAKVAFGAAGGKHAFEWCEPKNEPFRRKAFIDAFEEVATADPAAAPALPERTVTQRAITSGSIFVPRPEERRPLTDEQAKQILGGAIGGEPLATDAVVPEGLGFLHVTRREAARVLGEREALRRAKELEVKAKPIRVTEERLAELRAQAAATDESK